MAWRKGETETGVPYYVSPETGVHWDHPKFSEVRQAIDDCNYVIYARYRLALKLRVLQSNLCMDQVPLSVITTVFQKHKLGNSENSQLLETYDLEAILSDIFFATVKKIHTYIDVDLAVELLINFLYHVFDSSRTGRIHIFSIKLTLAVLSSCSLPDLHRYMFSLCVDHNNCITKIRLKGFLCKIGDILKFFHEDLVFGSKSLNAAVESCFRECPGFIGISEDNFMLWLNSEVPFLSWLPIVFKLKYAETVIHAVKCSTCKDRPLLGMRYECKRCRNYVQCQKCFMTGRTSKSHNLSHSMKEFYTVTSSRKHANLCLFGTCGLFCLSREVTTFSTVNPSKQFQEEGIKMYQSLDSFRSNEVQPVSAPDEQLQRVIRQLESQNRELQQMLMFGNYAHNDMRQYLEDYRLFMATNIKSLKTLKGQLTGGCGSPSATHKMKIPISRYPSCKSVYIERTPPDFYSKRNSSLSLDFPRYDAYNSTSTLARSSEEREFDSNAPDKNAKQVPNRFDEALAKLQEILATNFSLDETVGHLDNTNLKDAVTEVEGMLTSIIDTVESSKNQEKLDAKNRFEMELITEV